jgi:Protein kinase domain
MTDLPAHLRDHRYAVVRLLGEGGQAATFEAVDKKEGTLVAIKRFRVRGAKSWKDVELAEREARVLASVSHHALPRYVEHFEEQGELYLVTRKIEGESLAEAKSGGRKMSEASVVRLLRDASSALDYLHGRAPPLIHRDIKPSNVICRPDGSYAFIDFGAVRDKMKPEGGSTVVGTFGYMAPEQFQGRAMPASDVYAVGATAITLLTGREPEDLPHRGLAIDVKAALAGGRTSDAMRRVLEAMLEPDPDRRAPRIAPLLAQLGEPAEAPKYRGEPSPERSAPLAPEAREGEGEEQDRWDRAASRLPGPLLFLMAFGIGIAQIAVGLTLRVLIPVLFAILSIVFGKGLRTAGKTVNNAGKVAIRAMERAKGVVRTRAHEEVEQSRRGGRKHRSEPVRVRGPKPRGKVRVAGGDHHAEAEAELEAERSAEEASRREPRRKRRD